MAALDRPDQQVTPRLAHAVNCANEAAYRAAGLLAVLDEHGALPVWAQAMASACLAQLVAARRVIELELQHGATLH